MTKCPISRFCPTPSGLGMHRYPSPRGLHPRLIRPTPSGWIFDPTSSGLGMHRYPSPRGFTPRADLSHPFGVDFRPHGPQVQHEHASFRALFRTFFIQSLRAGCSVYLPDDPQDETLPNAAVTDPEDPERVRQESPGCKPRESSRLRKDSTMRPRRP